MFDPNDMEARLQAAAFWNNYYKIAADRGWEVHPEQKKVIDGLIYVDVAGSSYSGTLERLTLGD